MKNTKLFIIFFIAWLNCYGLSSNHYVVILAGGSGTRLWPLSRETQPKQLLPFDGKSLLELTLERVQDWIPQENIWVITNAQQQQKISDLVGNRVGKIIAEPASRNTAPAILLTSILIQKENKDAIIAYLPADHVIDPKQDFAQALEEALLYTSEAERIALLGVKPTFPATGYGYIEYSVDRNSDIPLGPYKIVKFHEKPSKDLAQFYTTSGHMLWNMGIFCGQASLFVDEFRSYAPQLTKNMYEYLDGKISYDALENISVDYALMEKSRQTVVYPVFFAWSDVGNLDIFLSLQQNNKTDKNKIISVDSQDNICDVHEKLVALVGVDNLCIVETDDVILVAKRSEVEKVKQVVTELKRRNKTHYL